MTKADFLRVLEAQLELPEGSLHQGQTLKDVEGWDSLATILFIALADEKLGVTVTGNDVGKARTINDLLALLGDKVTV